MTGGSQQGAERFHATSVAVGDAGALIVGPSGSGKSSLALQLIGLGARLVADDLTRVSVEGDVVTVHAPDRLQGVIEARGVGLIHVPWMQTATLQLVVDMSKDEVARHPRSRRLTTVAGCDIDLVLRVDAAYFPSAIYNLLHHGRYSDTT
ncbi:HPr kinase/phosphatase C-terminal domain-containing protein [Aliiroseovarius sediminis]|uniref:HPr kinase/phosphorylase n=1 Tax=Aliiroseovarius sediminis TaxID=2925839 RepID=UPI001F586C3D|nr:HPr kinase/phosphatase C-terminal domain-containing protein [uncultured Aliiroseovarius sp.]MCI2395846.1 HPr kinase/phosphatase C-terminal domain-containing protein [Aliiroseovarius sediminis]